MLVNLIAPVFAILWAISKQSQFRGCTAVTGTIINKQALVAELMVDIVVKIVAVAIKELLIHIHQIKVDIILF